MNIQAHAVGGAFELTSDLLTDEFENTGFGLKVSTHPVNLVIVDRRSLYGECFLAGLQAAEPGMRFSFFQTLDSWLASRVYPGATIILLCASASELEELGAGENSAINRVRALDRVSFIVVADDARPSQVTKALEMGAAGYILTSMNLRVVIQVLHLVHAGGTFVPASSFQNVPVQPRPELALVNPDVGVLSPRQVLVAKALRKGTPNKVIAYELNMCESTVKVHVRQIMKKLKAKNRTQIAFLTNSMFNEGSSA